MKKYIIFSIFLLTFSLVVPAFAAVQNSTPENIGRKVIVWRESADITRARASARSHATELKYPPLVRASVVEVTSSAELAALSASPDVASISDDPIATIMLVDRDRERVIHESARASARNRRNATPPPQSIPWGITDINAPAVWSGGNTGDPIKVGVIDTGISSSHPDLIANIKGGVNTIKPIRGWNDDNGHGSHVAGTIAALNNTHGVVGGAPQADLYAIKVLNSAGSGYYSDIIEGLQWAINNNLQVVNMSLGGTTNYQPLHDAITAARNAGILVVAAAGNSGGSVIYPAAYPEAVAVSALDSSHALASWSSRGPEVDLSAPGVSVYSTYKGTGYATLSGTSMATPHVVASAVLLLNSPIGSYDANSNGRWDPSEEAQKLEDTATDLGASGPDSLFGFGLVNALAAVQ